MKLDDVLHEIGEFGFYQKRVYFTLCMPMISVGSLMLVTIVLLYTPLHRCKIPGLDNDTFLVQNGDHQLSINRSIPYGVSSTYDKCHVYSTEGVTYDHFNQPINASVVPCSQWVYDKSVFLSTFASTMNLVCNDMMKTSHAQMFFFLGVLLGDFILGTIADMFGRKKALYMAFVTMSVASIVTAWAPDFYSFTTFQFIAGGASHGAFVCAAVIGLELVGPSKRVWTGMLLHVFFTVGLTYISAAAFIFREWRSITLACGLPTVLYLLYWWFLPESARWLLSKGRMGEFEKLLRRAASVNGTRFPDTMFTDKLLVDNVPPAQARLWHLFTSPKLLRRVVVMCFGWFVVSMTYYGVTLNAGNMAGNFFLNFFLMSVAGFPGLFIAMALVDKIGRRKCNSACLCLGGVACLCTIFTVLFGGQELQPLTTTLAVIGKIGAAGAFASIYLFTSELLPTVIRNAGMGLCSASARVGAMVAPYIAKSGELIGGKMGQAEPLVIFGALSILAGLSMLLLPETLNKRLPDTLEEGEQFGRKPAADETEVEVKGQIENEMSTIKDCTT